MTEYRDLLPIIIEQEEAVLPGGCDSWAFKSVYPDLRTRNGFRWAYPGGTSRNEEGDGLCVATTWRGMASGSIPARTILLVAYQSAEVLGRDDVRGKLRIAGPAHVVSIIDGERFVREHGARADLAGAYLTGANLAWANLSRVNMAGADLTWVNMAGADLTRANMAGADLARANMAGANLAWANMAGANLAWANMAGANLTRVNLAGADLAWVNMAGARGLNLPSGWTLTDTGVAVQS